MIAQSFFHQHLRPQEMPDCIILDTSRIVKELFTKIQPLPALLQWENDEVIEMKWGNDDVISIIMQFIAYEDKAILELEYGCLDMVEQALGTAYADDTVPLANAVVAFGKKVMQQLQDYKAYRNGYLFYQFKGWMGKDIILSRLIVNQASLIR